MQKSPKRRKKLEVRKGPTTRSHCSVLEDVIPDFIPSEDEEDDCLLFEDDDDGHEPPSFVLPKGRKSRAKKRKPRIWYNDKLEHPHQQLCLYMCFKDQHQFREALLSLHITQTRDFRYHRNMIGHDWTRTSGPDIEPPTFHVKRGRKKEKRIKGKFEVPKPKDSSRMVTITCSNCGLQGHRYTNCRQQLRAELALRKNKHVARSGQPAPATARSQPAPTRPMRQARSQPPPARSTEDQQLVAVLIDLSLPQDLLLELHHHLLLPQDLLLELHHHLLEIIFWLYDQY
ncbi:translation initiation factor IF-2-like [Hordeum vulgare]|nr:translation initiation factor IF-2-like [Hordeum vulgare]